MRFGPRSACGYRAPHGPKRMSWRVRLTEGLGVFCAPGLREFFEINADAP